MERWQQIESLFQAALEHNPAERNAWLREACQDDSDLRREVASLLANHQAAADSQPWAAAAAAQLIDGPASLEPDQCLGPYRIECFLAAGGMGQVYRATDTRLHRQVAIKVSSARFGERFEREARVIASLNHPNICQLHDVGPNYLVMEFVEGPTLAERIRKGVLPLDEALAIARQIAEALEAAHEKGIVHRDLKPVNVKVTPGSVVKVLDFGLAKAGEERAAAGDPSDSPTKTISATPTGVILGTAAYMSPEQARGTSVDKRVDIWAFGCVLYEMLSGKQAFHGETTSDILAAVLRAEPDWTRIPARVQPLLRRCLMKDPKHRLRDIGDAMQLVDGAPAPPPARRPWAWIAVAAALAIAAAAGWWRAPRPLPLHPLVRFNVDLSPGTRISRNTGSQLALSPDGTRIAFMATDADGKPRLATRMLDQAEFVPLSGTDAAFFPFFSPDGQWIGFSADGKLKKVAVQGGAPVTLCDAPTPQASWGDDGNIILALSSGGGLSRIPAGGGRPTPVTELNREKGETAHTWPEVLPGSQAVLFTTRFVGFEDRNIDVFSFKTGERKTVVRGGFQGKYLAGGHLVYMQQDKLFAVPFDLDRLAVTGAPKLVLEDVRVAGLARSASLAVSQTGTLVYVSWKGELPWSIFWLDSAGKTQPLHSTPGYYFTPRFSPDGNRLAFGMSTSPGGGADIWVKDLERDAPSRLTSLPGMNMWPIWTPDGRNLLFESFGGAAPVMYWIRADGSGEPQPLTDGKTRQLPYSFSPNGNRLVYSEAIGADSKIWTAPVEGDPNRGTRVRLGKAELFHQTAYSEGAPAFSPDGRWLAYVSNETGTGEVYVRPIPGPGSKWPISTGGGRFPIWSGKSCELFFLSPDRRIMVAGYTVKGDSFAVGKPQVWSQKRLLERPSSVFDLAPDGKRFAIFLYPDGTAEEEHKPTDSITVLLNFGDELQRLVPAGR
jgi:serine/threonine-protein kinase